MFLSPALGKTEKENTLRLRHQISVSQPPGRNPNFNLENILSRSRNNNLRVDFKHTFCLSFYEVFKTVHLILRFMCFYCTHTHTHTHTHTYIYIYIYIYFWLLGPPDKVVALIVVTSKNWEV